ncbi:hypothetical protein [Cupriavidus malaysiensis]|uniref:Uncharacterized protein n=1 Tax=Cupriavidus malaysiensis TaxID=367825 RepID=A0A1D9I403_9BURK|nr:hypothetical protein [Cupriavidus malaysiensis]AOZ06801.1 hypothetical protein BKK80_13960 [Cupriavidus malaysiensis]
MTTMKAYEVYDGGDNWVIVFATNSATARREGAGEIGCEWENIDHCRRKPELDRHAPGPVPPLALIAAGWHYECGHCGCRVDEDMENVEPDPHFDASELGPVAVGQMVYCSVSCAAMERAERRSRETAESALIELVETKYPGSKVTHVNVFGHQLEAKGGYCRAYFTFPGGVHHATYKYGESDAAWVSQCDAEAFRQLYRRPQDEAASQAAAQQERGAA